MPDPTDFCTSVSPGQPAMAAYHRFAHDRHRAGGSPLIVDRVDTNVAGLYRLGCATFHPAWHPVVAFVEQHLERLVVGRYPGDIADLIRLMRFSSYWREGPAVDERLRAVSPPTTARFAGRRTGNAAGNPPLPPPW